ncbi:hypothetical protein C8F01DRAFT_1369559, partial [Mycena amicta]
GLCVSSHPPCRFPELPSRPRLSPARRQTTENYHPIHPSLALCSSPPREVSKTTLSLATTLCSPSAVLAREAAFRKSLRVSQRVSQLESETFATFRASFSKLIIYFVFYLQAQHELNFDLPYNATRRSSL